MSSSNSCMAQSESATLWMVLNTSVFGLLHIFAIAPTEGIAEKAILDARATAPIGKRLLAVCLGRMLDEAKELIAVMAEGVATTWGAIVSTMPLNLLALASARLRRLALCITSLSFTRCVRVLWPRAPKTEGQGATSAAGSSSRATLSSSIRGGATATASKSIVSCAYLGCAVRHFEQLRTGRTRVAPTRCDAVANRAYTETRPCRTSFLPTGHAQHTADLDLFVSGSSHAQRAVARLRDEE